ncbi:MAG: hypothetical protein J0I41_24130, partial [Filimonas sp.]|nr:hypothetical protein [Filimonas sp.]
MRVVLLFLLSFLFCINVSAQTDKEFWFAAPEVTRGHVDSPLFVRVTTLNVPATVTISCPANPAFTPITQTIAANSIYSFPIGPYKEILENKPPNTILNYGLLVTSSEKILAYYDESSGNNPEIFALKGHNALGTNFIVPGQNTMNNGAPGRYNPQPYNSFDIVATQDNTKITIAPTKDVVGHLAGIPYTITLNRGQTYSAQAVSPLATQHLTGSTVTSNKPIAITYKDDSAGQSSCYDLMGDQIVPIPMLGLEYIVVNGDLNNGGTDQASILAVQDGTVVNVLQNGNLVSTQTLNKGQFFQYQFANSPIYIKSNKPISVLHITGTGCELGSAVVPQIGCTGSTTVGLTRPAGTDYFKIFVLAHTNAVSGFTFNGSSTVIKASDFTVMPGAPDWSYAKLDITSVLATNGNALIQNSIDKFHVGALFGTGSGCGYGYFSDYASYDPVISANTPLCVGSTLLLKCNPVNDPGDLSFNWDGPNGFISSIQNPTIPNVTTAASGTYNCQVFKQGCFYSLQSIDVTVNTYPVSTPTAPASVCLNGALPLTGNSVTGATYSWVGPAGSNFTSTQQSPIIDPVTNAHKGTYTLTVTTNGCSTSNTVFVDVKNTAIPVITGPGAGVFCEGATINLTSSSTSSPVTYSWTGPNGFSSTLQNPTITNATTAMSGTYSVLITSTATGCSDSKTANVTISTQPTIAASNEGAYCGNNNTAKLHAVTNLPAGDAIFTWTGPNGFTSSLQDPVINNAKQNLDAGLYTVTVKSASSGCTSASATTYLIITTDNTTPGINSISGNTICDGTTLALTANMSSNTPSPALYTWTGPNGYTKSGVDMKSISIPNATAATYNNTQFTLVVTTGCKTTSQTTTVTVNTRPILIITNPAAVCSGTSVNLTASAVTTWSIPNSNLNYFYYTNAAGTTTLSNPSNVTVGGTYYIKIQDRSTLCYSDIQSVTVTMNPTPSITSTLTNQVKCAGESTDPISITGDTPGASYTWTNDNTATGITVVNGSGDIPSFVTTNTGTSSIVSNIKVTPTLNGCSGAQKTVTVTVKPIPTVTGSADVTVCNGKPTGYIVFYGTVSGTVYTWVSTHPEIGLADNSKAGTPVTYTVNSFNAINTGNTPIVDSIFVTPTLNGCTGVRDTVVITVNPTPVATVSANQTLCNQETMPGLSFTSTVTPATLNWTNNTTSIGLAGSGVGDIAPFVVSNNGTTNVTATITVTPTQSGCVGTAKTVTITVKPTPKVVAPADITVCNGKATGNITLTGNINGATYTWIGTHPEIGLANSAKVGTPNYTIPSFNAINTAYTPLVDSMFITPSLNGCNGVLDTIAITVNPTPDVTVPANVTLCSGETTPLFSFNGNVANTIYSWSNNNASIGLAASGTGSIPAFTAVNNTSSNITASITVTPSLAGCVGVAKVFTITIKPTPKVTAPSDLTICNGKPSGYIVFYGTLSGTVYTWNGDHPEIGLSNGSQAGTPINYTINAFNGINTSGSPITNAVTVTPSLNGCNGTPGQFNITVNPTADVTVPGNIILCNGDATSLLSFTGNVAGTNFTWTNNTVSIGLAASGSGNIPAFTAINNTTATVTATITVTPQGTCAGTAKTFTITVKPTPKVTTPPDITICSGKPTGNILLTGNISGATYTWVNTRTDIGLANGSQTGTPNYTIPSFTAISTDINPIIDSVFITPSLNGCTGTLDTFRIIINPAPVLTSTQTPAAICSKTAFSYTATSATTGVVFSWSRAAVTGISNAAVVNQSGAVINETLINTTTSPIVVTYKVSMVANGCAANVQDVTVTVNPTPALNNVPASATICNNGTFNYTPASSASGVSYSWTRAAVPGISNPATSGNGAISEVLTNTLAVPVVVKYAYTFAANGCSNNAGDTVSVTVNPTPRLTNVPNPAIICSNSTFTYAPSSSTPGATYTWVRAAVNGISNTAASGSNGINETLTNTLSTPVDVKYVYSISVNGCVYNPADSFIVTVNPKPVLNNIPATSTICNDQVFAYTPASTTTGVTYSWSRAAVSGISPATANGNGSINETLHSDNSAVTTVTYLYTLSANGCTNSPTEAVTVNVNPTPKLNSPLTATNICNDGTVSYTPTSATTGTSFSWTRAVVAGITPATGSGNGNINETLHNASSDPVTVTYVYALSANGCAAPTTESVTVVVNPTPKLNSAATVAAICNDGTVSYTPTSNTTGTTYNWTRASVTGITPATGSGTGNINETLHNGTTDPITVTYVYTLSANGCAAPTTESITVVVKPSPKLNSPLTAVDICNDGTVHYAPSSATAGTTFSWTRAAVTGITPATGSGTGNINETLHSDNSDITTVSYLYTLSANGCTNSTTEEVKVNVKPTPKLSSPLTATDICNDGTVSYSPTSATSGTTYNWTRAAITGITPATSSGTGNINETLHNNTPGPVTVTYTYTLAANGCTAPATESVTVVVKPTPKLSSATTATTICNDGTVNYTPTSNTSGATYSWTRASVTGITPATGNGNGNINETLHNGTSDPVTVTYVYTLAANGCTSPATEIVTVVVKPTPKLSSVLTATDICNDGTVSYTPTSATTGTSFSWTRAAVSGITPTTNNGTGNINETLHNATTDPITVSYVYSLSANSCTAPATEIVTVVVKPTPKLSSASTATDICNDGAVSYTPTSATAGTTYSWTRASVTGITPATGSGTGNISETLHNATSDPITVTYVYTLSANGCTAPTTEAVTVVVKPTPKLSSSVTATAICNDGTVSYAPSSATAGTTYSWTRASVIGITPATGSGTGNVNETLHNATSDPITVTYVYTLSANGCTAPVTETVTVVVKPTPKLSSPLTAAAICNDGTISYTATSATAGTTYSWSRALVTGITPATNSGTGNINETLHNSTPDPITVTYVYTLSANGCTAPTTETVTVEVKPTPKLSSASTATDICNDGTVNYTPVSQTSGTTYTWARAATGHITPATGSGTGSINETLHNDSSDPVTVTYVYTLSANGCTAPATETITVVVKPTPKLSSASTATDICNDGTVNYTPSSQTSGTTYTWTRAATGHITPATGSGTGGINETLHNDSSDPVTVTYVYTLSANGCTAPATETITVVVKPTPKLSSASTATDICNDGTVNYTPASQTSGTTYAWIRAAVNHITPATGTGTGAISEMLHNDSNDPITVTYTYTLSANGCTAPATETVTVVVKPTPKLNSALTITAICNDGTVNYTPTSATTGTTYSWTRAAVTDITPSTGSGTSGITETLHNAGAAPQIVTYVYTLSANGCTAPGTEEVKVTVNPTPKLNSSLTIAAICNDGTVNYTPTSATTGTTYSWTRAAVTDITPSTGSGTGGIAETLHNAGTTPQIVTYVYTLSANGCTAPVTEEVKVTVNPTPKLN